MDTILQCRFKNGKKKNAFLYGKLVRQRISGAIPSIIFNGLDVADDPTDSEEEIKALQGKTLKTKLKQLEIAKSQKSNPIGESSNLSVSSEAMYKFGQEVSDLKVNGELVNF